MMGTRSTLGLKKSSPRVPLKPPTLNETRQWVESQLPRKPFAIGVVHSLIDIRGGHSRKSIRRVLFGMTNRKNYRQSLVASEHRFGIAGAIAGDIDPDHRAHAAEMLEK